MRLSIIIPVYQVKHTLGRCLDSIVGQSFRDWQAILVDDASTDGSADICDTYACRDARIQVIHLKKNAGLSAARNAGIDKAKGDYLTFIDSDDYIADDTLKMLMETLAVHPDYDMIEYPVMEHFGSTHPHLLQFFTKEYTDMLEYCTFRHVCPSSHDGMSVFLGVVSFHVLYLLNKFGGEIFYII